MIAAPLAYFGAERDGKFRGAFIYDGDDEATELAKWMTGFRTGTKFRMFGTQMEYAAWFDSVRGKAA